ncbi:MAG TPA: hypothetical protein VMV91_09465 [Rhodocyclaceae bacterium]|nr:hypothetical protein [Rhodocyclaceae bacterium]HUX24254.1 hypothetical protein [Burkholderiales bacterium]
MSTDTYGHGCDSGTVAAISWLSNPKRGDARVGGTLQYLLLDFAKKYAAAKSNRELDFVCGEIVGFSYYLECPEDALACKRAARERDRK